MPDRARRVVPGSRPRRRTLSSGTPTLLPYHPAWGGARSLRSLYGGWARSAWVRYSTPYYPPGIPTRYHTQVRTSPLPSTNLVLGAGCSLAGTCTYDRFEGPVGEPRGVGTQLYSGSQIQEATKGSVNTGLHGRLTAIRTRFNLFY